MSLRSRRFADAALLVVASAIAPISLVNAQAANITMPKQAAQRAAGAASARVEAQIGQAQGTPGQASTPRQEAAAAQARASRQRGGAAPPVVQSGAPTPAGAPDPRARAAGTAATPKPDPSNALMREVFEYNVQGRRDPFYSLLATGDLRPMLADLKLTTILYDLSGRRPVAVMGDVSTGLQYRVTTGMMLGRMRVTRILPRKVIFAIEEFGFSRADSLVLADKPQTRQ
jgi:hypothetical protein